MKKAVLLDIDGTVLDAWDFVFDAVKHAVTAHKYSYPSDQHIRKAMGGKPLVEFYEALLPGSDTMKLAKSHRQFQADNPALIRPFPKTKKTLRDLKNKGFLIAAVSNRMRESLLFSLKQTEIIDYFDVVVSAEDVPSPKPHKDHLLTALQKLNVDPVNSYMVGDTEHDILAGKNAGVKTVGVTYGFLGPEIKKYNPDYVIDDIEGLLTVLQIV